MPSPDPVRVFIGSSSKNLIEEKVLAHTLRARARSPLEIRVMDTEARPALGGVTLFSLARFEIPSLCGYSGKAIYLDSDQIVLSDISELWNFDLGDAAAAAVPMARAKMGRPYRDSHPNVEELSRGGYFLSSVMLLDCAKLKSWELRKIAEGILSEEYAYREVLWLGSRFKEEFGFSVKELPDGWNHLDVLEPGSKLVHLSDLGSQPWIFHHHPLGRFWESHYLEAVRKGSLSPAETDKAGRQGFISRRIAMLPRIPPELRPVLNEPWRMAAAACRWAGVGFRQLRQETVRGAKKCLSWAERTVLSDLDFSLKELLSFKRWAKLLQEFFAYLVWGRWFEPRREVMALISTTGCERVLLPLVSRLLDEKGQGSRSFRVTLLLFRKLDPAVLLELRSSGCGIRLDHFGLIRAGIQPGGKVVVSCKDQTQHLAHRAIRRLRERSVKTVSIQHGGCREDILERLATAASETILVWNREAFEKLVNRHGIDPRRLRVIGNPLHDRLGCITRREAADKLARLFPEFPQRAQTRKVALIATCMHTEYGNDRSRYARYLRHLYGSIDSSRVYPIVKMHPDDSLTPNLYRSLMPPELRGMPIIEPQERKVDFYSLLALADFLVTRASTASEEALLEGKPVVAFDLDSSGPSRGYPDLRAHPYYKLVYADPPGSLAEALRWASEMPPQPPSAPEPGHVERGAQAILSELQSS